MGDKFPKNKNNKMPMGHKTDKKGTGEQANKMYRRRLITKF
jgi:hypothetical protein